MIFRPAPGYAPSASLGAGGPLGESADFLRDVLRDLFQQIEAASALKGRREHEDLVEGIRRHAMTIARDAIINGTRRHMLVIDAGNLTAVRGILVEVSPAFGSGCD